MKTAMLVALVSLLFIGCSKDGAKSHLLNGPQAASDPQPTDVNMPPPDGAH